MSSSTATSGVSRPARRVFKILHEGWYTVIETEPCTYCSSAYVAIKPPRDSGKHSWCVAVENEFSKDRGGQYYAHDSQPQPLVSGVADCGGGSVRPHTLCSVPTTNSAGTVSSSDNESYCTVLPVRCSTVPSTNIAAAYTGLPFPCALLLLFHLDADQGRMWVSACLPGRDSTGSVEVFPTSGGSVQGVCPAVQPLPHARLHVMLFDC